MDIFLSQWIIYITVTVGCVGVVQGRTYALAFYSDRLGTANPYTPTFTTRFTTPQATFFRLSTANYTWLNSSSANVQWTKQYDKYFTVTSGIEQKGIVFESDHELFIQAEVTLGFKKSNQESFLVPEVTCRDTQFVVDVYNYPANNNRKQAVVVIAVEDNTQVRLRLRASSTDTAVTLMKYQTYTATNDAVFASKSLTGLMIDSTKPVAVIAYHSCAPVDPPSSDSASCNAIIYDVPSVARLGKDYLIPPIAGRNITAGYIIRVTAIQDTTVINVAEIGKSATAQAAAQAGDVKETAVSQSNLTYRVTCDKPCMVLQLNRVRLYKGLSRSDAFGVVMHPNDKLPSFSRFLTLPKTAFMNSISIVATHETSSTLKINGVNPHLQWDGVTLKSAVLDIGTEGIHEVTSTHDNPQFAVYLYAHGTTQTTAHALSAAPLYAESCTNISTISISPDPFCAPQAWETHSTHHLNQLSTTKCDAVFANDTVKTMAYRVNVSLAVSMYELTVYGKTLACKDPYMLVTTKTGCRSSPYTECSLKSQQDPVTLMIGQPGETGKSCTYRCTCSASTGCEATVTFYRMRWEPVSIQANNPKLCLFDVDAAT